MIIVHLSGGLGNQMFQYSAGLALSVYRKAPLLLDTRDFAKYRQHNGFELARVFSIAVMLAKPEDVRKILKWQSGIRFRYRLAHHRSLKFLRHRNFIVEPGFYYWPGIRNVNQPCYLMGYWPSERYFEDIKTMIRETFAFRQPLSDYNRDLSRQIAAVNAISIHIRRGDYADDYNNLRRFGLCPLSYYKEAIQYMSRHVDNPQFFIFSDDITWTKEHLQNQGGFYYVDNNRGLESYNDMHLMSMCKHHIIANSTFGWWGAWLNPSPTKIVIGPKRWFNSPQDYTRDLYPDGWIRL